MTTLEHWLPLCRRRDATAWKLFHQTHQAFVERAARRLGCPAADVDDVRQEAFVIAFLKIDEFQHGEVSRWLFRIVANLVASRARRARARAALTCIWGTRQAELETNETPDLRLHQVATRALIDRALARLTPKKREALLLFEVEGLSGEAIAERVGCPVATVWSRLHAARTELSALGRGQSLARVSALRTA